MTRRPSRAAKPRLECTVRTKTYLLRLYSNAPNTLLEIEFADERVARARKPYGNKAELDISPEQVEELSTLEDAIEYVRNMDDFEAIDLLARYGYDHWLAHF